MTSVSLENLTKIFGDKESGGTVAVEDLSLDIADGEFLVFLGPSGCGKTTTLRMIGGLESPTSGTVSFNGTVVNDVKARNRDIAMVFQEFALYPHMSVHQNLGFGLEREDNDLSREEIDEQVEDVAAMLEIDDLLGDKPDKLSGGQKQRVALGRAVVRQPRLFLFDEPLANLDAKLRKTMRTEIVGLQSELGITSAYVTHNQEEAMTIADKIAILDAGELQQAGTPAEVFNEPANLFVARFVGSPDMNLYDGTVSEREDTYRIEMDSASFDLSKRLVDTMPDSDEVLVGFRPQDLYQARNRDLSGPDVEADVHIVEPVGTEAVIHGETSSGDITAKINRFHNLSEGEALSLTIACEHIYLFDSHTEELLKGRLVVERAEESSANRVEL